MQVPLNRALFSWVFENLIRNAIDAMEGEGSIELEIIPEGNQVHVDVTDSGKGIPPSQHRTVFQPGFTTKKRGWGSASLTTNASSSSITAGRSSESAVLRGKGPRSGSR
ncbi:MAG: ATP-binding protein [Flavobacteriales bacterium]|nr:ATP-binding protein [Flavobacteriales bacterium]